MLHAAATKTEQSDQVSLSTWCVADFFCPRAPGWVQEVHVVVGHLLVDIKIKVLY